MEGLTPKEADAWASEMTRIVGGTIHELWKCQEMCSRETPKI
jgi:hypothetical protein